MSEIHNPQSIPSLSCIRAIQSRPQGYANEPEQFCRSDSPGTGCEAGSRINWKRWGPIYPNVNGGPWREDYSADGDAWNYLPRSCPLAGVSLGRGWIAWYLRPGMPALLCRGALEREGPDERAALWPRWPGRQPRRGCKGGLDYYLDSTPTHSYMKALYKYPQTEFPYDELVVINQHRNRQQREYELVDTGVFEENRYFDVFVEYAKRAPNDILIRLTLHNRGPDAAPLHVLPTLWYRNAWVWGCEHEGCSLKPLMKAISRHQCRRSMTRLADLSGKLSQHGSRTETAVHRQRNHS